MRVRDLAAHPEPYVTVAELAEYWLVGRKQIYKQIDAGTLPAIRLGPRLRPTGNIVDVRDRSNGWSRSNDPQCELKIDN